MFHLFEQRGQEKIIVASDADRADLEAFADEYHNTTPNHGPLFFAECTIFPVRFRVSFDADIEAVYSPGSDGKPGPGYSGTREDIRAIFARQPTVMFTAEEIASEVNAPIANVRGMLTRMMDAGEIERPERGKYRFIKKEA